MRLAGTSGRLARGTAEAVELGRWALAGEPGKGVTLRAAVRVVHAYWATQRPLDLTLDVGPRRYRWRGVEVVELSDSSCTVRLVGAPEKG